MPQEHEPKPWKSIEHLVGLEDGKNLHEFLDTLTPAEVARSISRLEEASQAKILTLLEPEDAADLIEELPDAQGADLIEDLTVEQAAAIVDEMDSDHRADLLGDLDDEDAEAILSKMDPEEAQEARVLLQYRDDTAGGIMVTEYVVFTQGMTVQDVLQDLRTNADEYTEFGIQYAYVRSENETMVGVLQLRDLVLSPGDRPISEIMIVNPVSVLDSAELDELEQVFDRYFFSGLPVVNSAGKLVGVVMRSDVEVAHSERTEKTFMQFSGIIGGEELRTAPVRERASQRLWWLSLNLILSLVAAWVVFLFEETIQQFLVLAALLPVLANVSGCSGNQAVAVSIREMTLGLINTDDVMRVIRMELAVGIINGVVMGVMLSLLIILWKGQVLFGVIVGLSLALNAILAVALGGAIPLILKRFDIDPAVAAAPILTTVVDTMGFFIILGLTTLLLM
jgi:magnesium transporter